MRTLEALGPFFAVDVHAPGAAPVPPWRPFAELTADPAALRGRIERVGEALGGAAEPRVAASVAHLGLVARLVAPALGAAVGGDDLDLRLGGLWWRDELGGPVPLSVPGAAAAGGPAPTAPPDPWGAVRPLTAATAALVPVSPRVLWGNVASAVNGAARQVAAARPDLAVAARAEAERLFRSPELSSEPGPPGPGFRRASCCLIYRVAPETPAFCGDCVLGRARRPPA